MPSLKFFPNSVSPAVEAEQIRLVYAQSMAIQLLGIVTGVVAAWAFWPVAHPIKLAAWLVTHLLLSFVRLAVTARFVRSRPSAHAIRSRWGPIYIVGTCLSGFVWGALSLLYQADWQSAHQIILFALYTGITAASFNTNSPYFVAFPAFYLPAVGCLSLVVLSLPGSASIQLWLLLLIYTAVMYFSALKFHDRLASSLEIRFENERLAKQLVESNDQLARLADMDALTGIANRRALDRYLETEWNRLCRSGNPLSLLFVDVDFFKQYNDTYGHEGGDQCLVRIAELLRNQVQRAGELVARFGGEEFAVVLPESDEAHARVVAEGIRRGLETLQLPHQGSRIGKTLTLSIGGATVIPNQTLAIDSLRLAADEALYAAKNHGRNRVVWAGTAEPLAAEEACRQFAAARTPAPAWADHGHDFII